MATAVREYLRTKFRDFSIITSFTSREMDRTTKENVFSKILGPFEAYVVSLQSLLIWERPYLSAVALVALNCAFWVIVSCSRRFYSFLSVVALIVLLYRTWVYQVWPEIRVPSQDGEDTEEWTPVHPQVLSVPELSQHLNDWCVTLCAWWDMMWRFRRSHPGMFCTIACGTFALLAIIGKLIPGVLLVYLLVMAVSLGPGVALYVVPHSWYRNARSMVGLSTPERPETGSGSRDSDLDEFLPSSGSDSFLADLTPTEAVPESRDELQVARELGLEILVREASEQEESLTEIFKGLGSFPDVEEVSEEEDDEETKMAPKITEEVVTSSDNNNGNGIHFVATHFKEESSESDVEEAFIEGLKFPPAATPDPNESSLNRPLSVSQRLAPPSTPPQTSLSRSSHGRLQGKAGSSASTKQSTSQISDVDISEYEVVSESELSS